ncbi:hypothetical protein [Bauldia litoralis]|uniref:hypothetical protein n=1 Tax=Bauldia litoralis TaxID=665467 RepID=UPI0032655275
MNSPTPFQSAGLFCSERGAAEEDRALRQRADHQVWWELRHARLRLALAENNIAWAQEALAGGNINTDAALAVLDLTFAEIVGDAR